VAEIFRISTANQWFSSKIFSHAFIDITENRCACVCVGEGGKR